MTQDSLLFIGDSGESLSHRRYFNWNFSLKKSKKSLQYVERYGIINFGRATSRRVGIGRRGRLKICCWQQRMGSSPIAGILMRRKAEISGGIRDLSFFHFAEGNLRLSHRREERNSPAAVWLTVRLRDITAMACSATPLNL